MAIRFFLIVAPDLCTLSLYNKEKDVAILFLMTVLVEMCSPEYINRTEAIIPDFLFTKSIFPEYITGDVVETFSHVLDSPDISDDVP
ncbi:MAG: hypothetical protein QXQ46_04415 [Thermoplasmatales archaeon]